MCEGDTPQPHRFDTKASVSEEDSVFRHMAAPVRTALGAYPYFAVVKPQGQPADREALERLASAVAFPSLPISGPHPKVSFTEVRIDTARAEKQDHVTRYSRTHQPLTLHTDSSYRMRPHELIVFQCVVADEQGGDTILAPVDDILALLGREWINLLEQPAYPFGECFFPILFGKEGDKRIRYYRAQIDVALESGQARLPDKLKDALQTLDRLLEETASFPRLRLAAGDILFIRNSKVLHGRTGFSPNSQRTLHRLRLHAEGFGPTGTTVVESEAGKGRIPRNGG